MRDTQKIKLSPQSITNEELDKLADWIKTYPQLTQGKQVEAFEKEFEDRFGGHATFVNSGSSANLLALYVLGTINNDSQVGKKVVVPALSWITDYAPVIQLGMTPILCDCNMYDLSLDLNHLEQICKEYQPDIVIAVSVLGMDYNRAKLRSLAENYGFFTIADHCESLGLEECCDYATIVTNSFYYSHHISTIEGGMCSAHNPTVNYKLKSMRNHGWARNFPLIEKGLIEEGFHTAFEIPFTFFHPGFNFRNTEIGGFLGQVGLKKLSELNEKRSIIRQEYAKYLYPIKNHFHNQVSELVDVDVYFSMPLVFKLEEDKNAVIYALKDICESRPLIAGNIARQPFFYNYGQKHLTKTPNADIIDDNGIYVPLHEDMSAEDVKIICEVIRKVIY